MHVQRIGSHRSQIDGDVVTLRWFGDLLPQDVTDMHAQMATVLETHPLVFVVIDARAVHSIGRDTRRVGSDWPHIHRIGAVAVVGASLTVRAALTIVRSVAKVMSRKGVAPMNFAETEEEARAWIDAQPRDGSGKRAGSTHRQDTDEHL
jgi:hypothetical protein